jgi:hypothetical protein
MQQLWCKQWANIVRWNFLIIYALIEINICKINMQIIFSTCVSYDGNMQKARENLRLPIIKHSEEAILTVHKTFISLKLYHTHDFENSSSAWIIKEGWRL